MTQRNRLVQSKLRELGKTVPCLLNSSAVEHDIEAGATVPTLFWA